ncbi:MAG: FadR family transcriptional regulator [Candidatus Hydrogenedentes bacterium]|nr:FadR family transcriptional regulator [Candidatus Hydrogenedentota bacterium]
MKNQQVPQKEQTRTASQVLATTLIRQILDGYYPPDKRMPAEREMAQQYHLSRHVVREALKHLEALGMIDIQQGSGVYPKDLVVNGGMELFEYLLFSDNNEFDRGSLLDLLVFLRLFVPNVMRLAAENRSMEDIAEMKLLLSERALTITDNTSFNATNSQLLRILSRSTHNIIYQLLFNNIGRILTKMRSVVPIEQFAPVIDQHSLEELVHAIEEQDAELASLLTQRLAERSQKMVTLFLKTLPKNK